MTPSLRQVDSWMASQHRLSRSCPTPVIPAIERIDAVEFVARALWAFASRTGVNLGKEPTAMTDDAQNQRQPVDVLAALAKLHAEVLAAYHTYGLAACCGADLYELTNRACSPGAGPAHHDPDFTKVMKDIYKDLPDEHVFD